MPSHRLVLTSDGPSTRPLHDEVVRLLGKDKATCWYIPTAPLRDGWSKGQVKQQVQRVQQQFNLGRIEWIDPEYTKGEELKAAITKLGSVDLIYAEMGNTYNLCYHLWRSGGAQIIYELMDKGALYVGSSAGSIMAGRTCQMALWKNWDDQSCEGTVNVDWTDREVAKGLDLAGGRSIFPHANGQYARKAWQEAQAQKHGHTDHEVVTLADGQGLVIEGDSVKVV